MEDDLQYPNILHERKCKFWPIPTKPTVKSLEGILSKLRTCTLVSLDFIIMIMMIMDIIIIIMVMIMIIMVIIMIMMIMIIIIITTITM